MCGICGFVGFPDDRMTASVARAMSDTLVHRGPDGDGVYELRSEGVGEPLSGWFGHRRLKVIDLSNAADQPMVSDDGAVVLTFNGEIYNFRELRRELESHGHGFRSTGDTEVVLRSYLEWGEDFVQRLDGMFAIALWDARPGRLLLARDRVGKKPLFYTRSSGILTFGSEIKALLAVPWLEAEPDLSRLPEFLLFGYVPNPGTLYRGIYQVPPAAFVTYDADGLHGPRSYWDALPGETDLEPSEDVEAEVARLVREATKRRMVADVPLGVLLSGGIDSSIVVALMSQLSREPILTFTAGFPEEPSFDESEHARRVAQHFGTRHTDFTVEVDTVGLLDRLLWHHDQPYADSSAIPTYLVSRMAREHVTVVLNGDGGDEVFGGYERFNAAAVAARLPHGIATVGQRAAALVPRTNGYYSLGRRAQRFFEGAELPFPGRYLPWIAVFDQSAIRELLATEADEGHAVSSAASSIEACYERAAPLPVLDRILYANFCTYLPDDLAVKMDRMSMANSLEARSPFLDTTLVEYVSRIPARRRVGLRQTKPLLRKVFAELLPLDIRRRKKHGFGVPMNRWFRGDLAEVFEDEVLARDARTSELLKPGVLHALWDEHVRGDRDHGPRLWTILTLERWLRTLEGPEVRRRVRAAPRSEDAVYRVDAA